MSLYDDVDREAVHDYYDELPYLCAEAQPDPSEYEYDADQRVVELSDYEIPVSAEDFIPADFEPSDDVPF